MKKNIITILLIVSITMVITIFLSIYLFSNKEPYERKKELEFVCATDDSQILSDKAEKGHEIFLNNCAACHKKKKDAKGPALGNFMTKFKFPNEKYIYNYIIDEEFLEGESLIRAQSISKEYGSDFQHKFNLNKSDINNLIEYLN